jgi:large subunit ribosomal protein L4
MAENTTMSAPTFTSKGAARESVALPADQFDGTINMPVMHQAVKAYLANQRQGNASTKTRGFVIGGNQKPWKQKGTGRARQGSIRAPNWVGGGTVFGPTPRAYDQVVPKKVRALARKSAFNARAKENALIVIEAFDYDAPKTSQLLGLLDALGVTDKKVLILTDGVKRNVYLSGRNLQRAHVMPYSDVSTYHILWSDVVLVESNALGATDGESAAAEQTNETGAAQEKSVAARKSAAKSGRKAAAKTRTAKSAARKTTAKKTTAKKTTRKSASKEPTAKKKSRSNKKSRGNKKPRRNGKGK